MGGIWVIGMWCMKPNYWKKQSIYAGVVILISGGDLSESL